MSETKIEWTDTTWNPTTGCDKVSPGCDNCYAMTMAKRLKAMGQAKYQNDGDPKTSGPGFKLTVHPDVLEEPHRWRKPRKVFVNSMSDLLHKDVPTEFLARVWSTMACNPQHTFQVLTKRPARARSFLNRAARCEHGWWTHDGTNPSGAYEGTGIVVAQGEAWPPPNVWLGTSVEDQKRAELRIPPLVGTVAAVRFLSCEPLLGPVDLRPYLHGLHWVIVGGESGRGSRRMDPDWVRKIIADCHDYSVPVFVKQMGSVWARDTCWGGELVSRHDPKGGDPKYWPVDLRVREWPNTSGDPR